MAYRVAGALVGEVPAGLGGVAGTVLWWLRIRRPPTTRIAIALPR
jgi:hypothetical protein